MEKQLSLFSEEEIGAVRSKKLTTKQRATLVVERCNEGHLKGHIPSLKDMLADVKKRFDSGKLSWQKEQSQVFEMLLINK